MTRHIITSQCDGDPVQVVAGYDRPLREFFLQVWDHPEADSRADQELVYASNMDPLRDWSSLASVKDVLEELEIPLPESVLDALDEDQALNRGNCITHHAPVPRADIQA